MKTIRFVTVLLLVGGLLGTLSAQEPARKAAGVDKPDAEGALDLLRQGNARFTTGAVRHPHTDAERLALAGSDDQGKYAYATVLACSDSRVPVERIFDAGVMDLFTIRVAGNVCGPQVIGTVEYGLAHVHTPVLVVLGHTQCGAVTAVVKADHQTKAGGHRLERNIPCLLQHIEPAVAATRGTAKKQQGDLLSQHVSAAVEENVYHAIEVLFRESPVTRQLVDAGSVRVVGAVYDIGSGQVHWLPEQEVYRRLGRAETDPRHAVEPYAEPAVAVQGSAPKATPAHR